MEDSITSFFMALLALAILVVLVAGAIMILFNRTVPHVLQIRVSQKNDTAIK